MANPESTRRSAVYQCQFCKQEFRRYNSRVRSKTQYCSRRCDHDDKAAAAQLVSLAEHFWTQVSKTDNCWVWKQAAAGGWYGNVHYRKTQNKAHRVSWELHFGPIPEGLRVCHRCDNPPCVRPDHLFLGTAAENSIDMDKKCRHPRRTYVTFEGELMTLTAFGRMLGIPQRTAWQHFHINGFSLEKMKTMALKKRGDSC